MKILHTSDWHVGRTIRGRERSDEFRAVLGEITTIARDEAVDLILVVGDLFETAAPGPESEQIVYETLLGLADVAPVAIVAGNHDNERRLQAVQPLLELGRVVTRAMVAAPEDGGVATFETTAGERARVALLPFLSQRYIVRAEDVMRLDPDEHALKYADRSRRLIAKLCEGFTPDSVNVVAAHLMVAGGALGGGERLAHTIFEYCVPATAFPPDAHYVALGHLHRAQSLPAPCPTWYCGSPLQLDFGETADRKAVLVVEASPGAPATVREVPLTTGRRLRTLEGTLDQVMALRGTTEDDHLRIRLFEQARAGLADEIRDAFEHCVDVVVGAPTDETEPLVTSRAGRSPHDLFEEYLTEKGARDERVLGLFDDLLDEAYATPSA